MKDGIHPDQYRPVVFQDAGASYSFVTRSTVRTTQTIQWTDGKTYPLFPLDISSASHPFFTGKQKFVDTAGRVERFQRKYSWTEGKQGGEKGAPAPGAPGAPASAADKGDKKKGIEASSLKQFAARSKHAPAPVAPPKGDKAEKKPKAEEAAPAAEAKPEAATPAEPQAAEASPAGEAGAEAAASAEGKVEKAPKAEKKPKGEKKPKAEKAPGEKAPPAEKAEEKKEGA